MHHLLDDALPGGPLVDRGARLLRPRAARSTSRTTAIADVDGRDLRDRRRCRTCRASARPAASRAATSATSSARRTRRRRSPTTRPRRWCSSRSFNSKDDTESVSRDVAAIRKIAPKPTGDPIRSFVTGPAGFDADRSARGRGHRRDAAGDHDGARPRPDAADLPLAADRGADARGGGDRLRGRDGRGLRPRRGGRDHGQRPVDGDPDRADVRRGHGLLPADRLAASATSCAATATSTRRWRAPRCARRRRSSPRAGSWSPRCSCSGSPTSTRRARWGRSSRSASS